MEPLQLALERLSWCLLDLYVLPLIRRELPYARNSSKGNRAYKRPVHMTLYMVDLSTLVHRPLCSYCLPSFGARS